MSMPAVGDPAPEVALPDDTGTIHRLADQRGRWTILYFYPKDDTPGCTVEACEFRDANEDIPSAAPTSGGSARTAPPASSAFSEKFGLPFTLLSDEDHAVAEAYGSWVEKKNYGKSTGASSRTTFLVDPTAGSPRSGRKVKAGGPCRRRPGGPRRGPGRGRLAAAMATSRTAKGDFARGGRRAKPRSRSVRRTDVQPDRGIRRRMGDPVRRDDEPDRGSAHRPRPRLAARPLHGHRRPPGRRRLRTGRDRGPLDRCGVGRLARVLHERRPGRRGPGRRPAGARGHSARPSSARRPRSSATPASRFLHQPDGALANDLALREHARPRDPDVPPRRRPDAPTRRSSSTATAGSTTPTTGPRGWPPSTPSTRPPAIRWPFPWLARDGLAAHASAGSTCSGPTAPNARVDIVGDDRPQDRGPARPTPARSRIPTAWPSASGTGPPRRAPPIGVAAAEASLRVIVDRRGRGSG